MKTTTLSQFLTEVQIAEAIKLYKAHGTGAVLHIQAQVIEPNLLVINEKLSQENDARYLAYAVLYALMQSADAQKDAPWLN